MKLYRNKLILSSGFVGSVLQEPLIQFQIQWLFKYVGFSISNTLAFQIHWQYVAEADANADADADANADADAGADANANAKCEC